MEPVCCDYQGHRSLPLMAYDLIAQLLPRSDLPAARLSCRELAAAVDSHIQSLDVHEWTCVHQLQRLQHVQTLKVTIQTPGEWQLMQQLARQLPQISYMSFNGRRTWQQLNANSGSAQWGQLQGLQAARFEGIVKGLDDVASLAPNLQHLFCAKLILTEPLTTQLASVTHFGSNQVQVEADGSVEGGFVFASAFPNLQVLYKAPEFTFNPLHNIGFQRVNAMRLSDALALCTNLHSLRVFGDTTTMHGMLPGHLQQLAHIKRVAVYGIGPAAELRYIGKLKQLQHLWLTFQLPAKKAVCRLLQELLQLPQLLTLALPAKLLCSRCCSGMQQHVDQLAWKTSITQLTFLQRPADDTRRKQSGDYCPHEDELMESYVQLEATYGASARHSSGQLQQQTPSKRLQLAQLQCSSFQQVFGSDKGTYGFVPEQCSQTADGSAWGKGVWGLLGPVE